MVRTTSPPQIAGYPAEMSELDILASFAVQQPELSHHAFKKKARVHNTFMYSCVDPDAMTSLDKSPLRAVRAPARGGRGSVSGSVSGSPVAGSPLARSLAASPLAKNSFA
eukprot:3152452-Rhodomonas_salina.2